MPWKLDRGQVYVPGEPAPYGIQSRFGDMPLNVKVFGAKGDGVADDGPALQRAFDTAVAAGRSLYLPRPSVWYRTTSPLTLSHANGTVVFGDNAKQTTIYFDLPAGSTGLKVHNGHTVVFRDFMLRGSDTASLLTVVHVEVDSTHPGDLLSTSMRWQNMRIVGGNAYSEYGVLYRKAAASATVMNDLSVWYATDILKVRRAAFAAEDDNSKQHYFRDCKFLYLGRGTPGSPTDGWDLYPTDEGYGIWLKKGSCRWSGGYMGVVKGSAFRVDNPDVDGLVICDGNYESMARLLDISSASGSPYHVRVEGNRFSSAYTNAPGAASETDSLVIKSANSGEYSIRNNGFGEGNQTGQVKFAFTHAETALVEIVGNHFDYLGSDTGTTFDYPVGAEVEIYGNRYKSVAGVRSAKTPIHQGW